MLLYRFFAKVILGEIEMSKKNTKILNEVRRFMALANLDASLSSNFITKLEEMDKSYMRDDEEMEEGMHGAAYQRDDEEEESEEMEMDDMEVEEEPEMEDEEMEMDMEMDVDIEEEPEDEAVLTDDEADAIIALADKLRAARDDMGGEEEEVEMDAEEEIEMMEESAEETLEEILDSVLEEEFTETDEEEWMKGKSVEDIKLAKLQKKAAGEPPHEREPSAGDKAKARMRARDRKSATLTKEEQLVQEVLRRVKTRLQEMKTEKE